MYNVKDGVPLYCWKLETGIIQRATFQISNPAGRKFFCQDIFPLSIEQKEKREELWNGTGISSFYWGKNFNSSIFHSALFFIYTVIPFFITKKVKKVR